jgi:hypothetical protein
VKAGTPIDIQLRCGNVPEPRRGRATGVPGLVVCLCEEDGSDEDWTVVHLRSGLGVGSWYTADPELIIRYAVALGELFDWSCHGDELLANTHRLRPKVEAIALRLGLHCEACPRAVEYSDLNA